MEVEDTERISQTGEEEGEGEDEGEGEGGEEGEGEVEGEAEAEGDGWGAREMEGAQRSAHPMKAAGVYDNDERRFRCAAANGSCHFGAMCHVRHDTPPYGACCSRIDRKSIGRRPEEEEDLVGEMNACIPAKARS